MGGEAIKVQTLAFVVDIDTRQYPLRDIANHVMNTNIIWQQLTYLRRVFHAI